MGYWTGFCLKKILSVEIEVLQKENIISDKKFFIASSHQSMLKLLSTNNI